MHWPLILSLLSSQTLPGQPPPFPTELDFQPTNLIARVRKAIQANRVSEFRGLAYEIKKELSDTKDDNRRHELNLALSEMEEWERIWNNDPSNLNTYVPDVDQELIKLYRDLNSAMDAGKPQVLGMKAPIERKLQKKTKAHPLNQSFEFILRKALVDINNLERAEKKPELKTVIDLFFNQSESSLKAKYITKIGSFDSLSILLEASRIRMDSACHVFGANSFFHAQEFWKLADLYHTSCILEYSDEKEAKKYLFAEMDRLIKSEWKDNLVFELNLLRTEALIASYQEEPDLQQLEKSLTKLEQSLSSMMLKGSSSYFPVHALKLRLLYLQKKHHECVKMFESFPEGQLNTYSSIQPALYLNFLLTGASAYWEIGKKGKAIQNQENALVSILGYKPFSTPNSLRFPIKVATRLREMLAETKEWGTIRDFEERCSLLGIPMIPFPNQPGEKFLILQQGTQDQGEKPKVKKAPLIIYAEPLKP